MKIWFSEVVYNFKIKSLLIQILFVSFHSSVLTRQNKTENRDYRVSFCLKITLNN